MQVKHTSMHARKGSVVVEFAVTLPLMIVLLLGTLEMGRAMNVKHALQEAARAGCRMAVLKGSTNGDVQTLATASLDSARIENYTLAIDPVNFQETEEGDPITVTMSSAYSDVSWFLPLFFNGDISGSCTMRTMRREPVDYPEATSTDSKKANKKVAKKVGKKEGKKVGKKANKKQLSLSWKKNKKT